MGSPAAHIFHRITPVTKGRTCPRAAVQWANSCPEEQLPSAHKGGAAFQVETPRHHGAHQEMIRIRIAEDLGGTTAMMNAGAGETSRVTVANRIVISVAAVGATLMMIHPPMTVVRILRQIPHSRPRLVRMCLQGVGDVLLNGANAITIDGIRSRMLICKRPTISGLWSLPRDHPMTKRADTRSGVRRRSWTVAPLCSWKGYSC